MSEDLIFDPNVAPPPPTGKVIYHAHISIVHQTARWPSPMRAIDIRYQRQPGPYDPVALIAQYAPRYFYIPGFGTQGCRNGEGAGMFTAVDWVGGFTDLQAQIGNGQDLVVFCDCLTVNNRAHRFTAALLIAQATGRTLMGALPGTVVGTLPAVEGAWAMPTTIADL